MSKQKPLDEDYTTKLLNKALAARLHDDRGVVVHDGRRAFLVYKNVERQTLGIHEDKKFLDYPHGGLVTTFIDDGEKYAEPTQQLDLGDPAPAIEIVDDKKEI
jgi:hypothetical protein